MLVIRTVGSFITPRHSGSAMPGKPLQRSVSGLRGDFLVGFEVFERRNYAVAIDR